MCSIIFDMLHRVDAHAKNPEMWSVMRGQLDGALVWTWEEASETGTRLSAFLRAYMDCLSLFHDPPELIKASNMKDEDDRVESAEAIRVIVHSSHIGKSLFSQKWAQASRVFYRKESLAMIANLMDHGFDDAEHDAYKCELSRHTAELISLGHQKFAKLPTTLAFMNEPIKVQVECPQDEWDFRLAACMKACAFNSRTWKPLKYELLINDPGSLPDIPTVVQIPAKHLQRMISARDTLEEAIENETTVSGMIKKAVKISTSLKKLDRTFCLDLGYLEQRLEIALRKKVEDMTMACLPEVEDEFTYKESMKRLAVLRKSRQYIACVELQGDIVSIEALVCTLAKGYAPKVHTLSNYTTFFKRGLKRVENFFRMEHNVQKAIEDGKGDGPLQTSDRRGISALLGTFKMLEDGAAPGATTPTTITVADLKPLKLFPWVFTKTQHAQLARFIQVYQGSKGPLKALPDESHAAGQEDAPVAIATKIEGIQKEAVSTTQIGGASSSTSSMGSKQPLETTTKRKLGAKDCPAKKPAQVSNMMKFFVPKPRAIA